MSLPISNQFRVCTSCYETIAPGDSMGHDPDGDIICVDCVPSDFDFEQYDEPDFGFADASWNAWQDERDGCYD